MQVLKDMGELISLTLDQAQNHRRLSGSTQFNRIDVSRTLDPLNGKNYSQGLYALRRGAQGGLRPDHVGAHALQRGAHLVASQ